MQLHVTLNHVPLDSPVRCGWIKYFCEYAPDVTLMDPHLPDMSGIDFYDCDLRKSR